MQGDILSWQRVTKPVNFLMPATHTEETCTGKDLYQIDRHTCKFHVADYLYQSLAQVPWMCVAGIRPMTHDPSSQSKLITGTRNLDRIEHALLLQSFWYEILVPVT